MISFFFLDPFPVERLIVIRQHWNAPVKGRRMCTMETAWACDGCAAANFGKHRVCGACRFYRYCNVACQKRDWKREGGHRATCVGMLPARIASGTDPELNLFNPGNLSAKEVLRLCNVQHKAMRREYRHQERTLDAFIRGNLGALTMLWRRASAASAAEPEPVVVVRLSDPATTGALKYTDSALVTTLPRHRLPDFFDCLPEVFARGAPPSPHRLSNTVAVQSKSGVVHVPILLVTKVNQLEPADDKGHATLCMTLQVNAHEIPDGDLEARLQAGLRAGGAYRGTGSGDDSLTFAWSPTDVTPAGPPCLLLLILHETAIPTRIRLLTAREPTICFPVD
jgi:hypothetical protein